ncbi:MAG TPA: methyltransferase domain-containing protein [Anaeromyxobacteraceae bacterium]|nr:methyltransferase domain-containing protein [Anaeromyxobacteraceae bacterium]
MSESDNLPNAGEIQSAVSSRYAALSCCSTSLSCGGALDRAAVAPGETFVDLGCGRGQDVIRAAGRVGVSGRAIGVDATDEMLAKARRSVPPFLANATFVKSDLAALDLPASFADVVISNCSINHARDKAAVYAEIHRILRPGGRFVVSDVIAETELPESVRRDPAAWAACYGGAIPEPEYVAAIRAAGFAGVEILDRTAPYEKGGVQVRSLTVRGLK